MPRMTLILTRELMTWLMICMMVGLSSCGPSVLEKAYASIPIGTPRDEAIRILRGEAWYHQPCPSGSYIDDLFFAGIRHYDWASLAIVRSTLQEGEYRVTQIGSFDEPSYWHGAYADCIDKTKFEK